jgi:hypothetical protein
VLFSSSTSKPGGQVVVTYGRTAPQQGPKLTQV